jgi:hypothetical protein
VVVNVVLLLLCSGCYRVVVVVMLSLISCCYCCHVSIVIELLLSCYFYCRVIVVMLLLSCSSYRNKMSSGCSSVVVLIGWRQCNCIKSVLVPWH